MVNNANILYREVQYFRQIWVWILLIAVSALTIWSVIQQVLLGKSFGDTPAPDAVLVIILITFGFGFPYTFYKINLTTEVRSDGIYYRFSPFHRSFHKIAPEDIERFQVRIYRPIREYGGWGIRYRGKSKAYNVSGNRGVQLELSNGKQLLFGSQRPEELAEALNLILGRRQP